MAERTFLLEELARLVGGTLHGDAKRAISGIQSLQRAGPADIAFLAKGRQVDPGQLRAGALVVAEDAGIDYPHRITVKEPYLAFARLLDLFHPRRRFSQGIDPTAVIGADCRIDPSASIGPFCFLGENVSVGPDCEIHAGVIIYGHVAIGAGCLIYSRVVIRENTEIGDGVIIQPGAVIGADGFGFGREEDGSPVKIPQVGKVVIGAGCEIGANTCIDRSTIEETVLSGNVKLDNLIQIGHNVTIGAGTAISAQTGISGSTRIGENVIMGGQVGIGDHLNIASGTLIAAKTGVTGSISRAEVVAGYPHQEIRRWRRNQAILRNLDELRDKIKMLEQRITDLEGK